jgi:hypothetical protein
MRHIIMSSLTATGVLAGLLFTGVGVAAAAEPVLPEFDDPLSVENAELDLTALELEGVSGNVALRNGEVTGL